MGEKKSLLDAISETEGRIVLAGVMTVGLMYLCLKGAISGDQMLAGLFGAGGIIAIIGKKNGNSNAS